MGTGSRIWPAMLTAAMSAALVTVAAPSPAMADGNEAPGALLAARSITGGVYHSCALLNDGTVKCWGNSTWGQLGLDTGTQLGDEPGEMATLPPVDLGVGRTATAVSAGNLHSCALLDDGTVKCWGFNQYGQLGQDSTVQIGDGPGEMAALAPVDLGVDRTATAVTAGDHHSCALLDDGTVKCWGFGSRGRLGQDSTTNIGDDVGDMAALGPVDLGLGRTAEAIGAGGLHTCALLDDGTVKCWGFGNSGQLGRDNRDTLGDAAGEMAALVPVDLGPGRTARAIAAGQSHTCALLDDGAVKCWGDGLYGQLGQDSVDDLGDGPGEMAVLGPVDLGVGRIAIAITAGRYHTCAVLDDGTVRCWGDGRDGRLGYDTTATLGDEPGEMAALPPVYLGAGRTALTVTAGGDHTCAVSEDGTVKCWGADAGGQLGQDTDDTLGDEPGEMVALGPINLGGSVGTVPGSVSGTVTEDGSGSPIEGVWVAASNLTTGGLAGTTTDAAGGYSVVVEPGDQLVEFIDPTATHGGEWYDDHPLADPGSPELVSVSAASGATADAALAPGGRSASVAGTVTEDGSVAPVAGAFVAAIGPFPSSPSLAGGVLTDASGEYRIDGLEGGDYGLVFVDPTAGHATEFHDDSPGPDTAALVALTAGATTTTDAALASTAAPGATTTVSGTVTEAGTGAPIEGAWALALTTTGSLVGGGVTDGSGAYSVPVAEGDHLVEFVDPSGGHTGEWNLNHPLSEPGSADPVTAGPSGVTVDADLVPDGATGSVAGTVTETGGGALAGAWVAVIHAVSGRFMGGATTDGSGGYSVGGLAAGDYVLVFADPSGDHTFEYHPDAADFASASPVAVAAGTATTVDAGLDPTP